MDRRKKIKLMLIAIFAITVLACTGYAGYKICDHYELRSSSETVQKVPQGAGVKLIGIQYSENDCYAVSVLNAMFNLENFVAFLEKVPDGENTIESYMKRIYNDALSSSSFITIDKYRDNIFNIIKSTAKQILFRNAYIEESENVYTVDQQNDVIDFLVDLLSRIDNVKEMERLFCIRWSRDYYAEVHGSWACNGDLSLMINQNEIFSDGGENLLQLTPLDDKDIVGQIEQLPMILMVTGLSGADDVFDTIPKYTRDISGHTFHLKCLILGARISAKCGHYFVLYNDSSSKVWYKIDYNRISVIDPNSLKGKYLLRMAIYERFN